MRLFSLRFVSWMALLLAGPLQAATPLDTTNQAALARAFALPSLGHTQAVRDSQWRLALDLSTEFVNKQSGGEALLLDGESQRWSLGWRAGIGEGWDLGVEVPLLYVDGGFMDDLVEDWHDFFGLPNGGRENVQQDDYRYAYTRNGAAVLDNRDDGTALGDVRVDLGRALREGWMLRAQIKLPTGDDDRLAGGNLGAALWTDWALPVEPGAGWGGFVSAGLSANEKADALEDQQRELVPFGGAGLEVRVLDALALLGQLYLHGPLYEDSQIAALHRAGVQLALGGRWCPRERSCLELSFQEDLAVGVSPDFSLRLAVSLR